MQYKAFMIKYAEIGTKEKTDIYLRIYSVRILTESSSRMVIFHSQRAGKNICGV